MGGVCFKFIFCCTKNTDDIPDSFVLGPKRLTTSEMVFDMPKFSVDKNRLFLFKNGLLYNMTDCFLKPENTCRLFRFFLGHPKSMSTFWIVFLVGLKTPATF